MRPKPAFTLFVPLRLVVAFAIVLILRPAVSAQTWDGGLSHGNLTFNNNWSTPNNWIGQVPPTSSPNTNITFTQSGQWTTANQNIASPFQLNSITLDANNTNFTAIGGSQLDFHTNGSSTFPTINQNSAVNVAISNNVNMTNSLTIGGSGMGNLTLSGAFSGAGSLTTTGANIILTGAGSNIPVVTASSGSLTLSGGSITITGASLPLNSGLGSGAPVLTINNGANVNVPSTDSNAGVTVAGPAGTAMVVDGSNTKLMSGSYIVVGFGDGGQGQMTVQNGASVTETTQSLEIGTFSGDNGEVLVQSGGAITTTNVILGVLSGSAGTLTVTGGGSKVTVSGSTLISFTHGNGKLVVSNVGAFAANGGIQFGQDPSSIVVNGGTLTTPSIAASNPANAAVQISDPVGGVALTISPTGATTYPGAIMDATGGPGTVVKTGSQTLTLSGVLTNTGGYTATGGSIEFSGAVVQPGSGSLTAASGATMQYDNNARIFGGFLYGPGTHLVSSATFTGSTSTASATINVQGVGASFISFSNGGNLSVAPNIPVTTLSGFTNQGSGSVTVGANSSVNVSDFQTYGTLTLNPATVTENFSQTTLLRNTGTTQLFFNGGSRTFVGTPSTALFPSNWPDTSLRGQPTFVAGVDLKGKNATVAGGLFVNNGYVEDSSNNFQGTATVVADFGSLVKGAGYFQNSVITQNGGKFQAGNSPGSATFGSFVLGPGGVNNYVFAIDDATGAAGPNPDALGHVSGWGLVRTIAPSTNATGDFTWTATPATPLTVAIQTLINPTTVGTDIPGPMADFNPNQSYSWPAVEWAGSYAGPSDAASLDGATVFDTSDFANPIAGTFGWALDTADQTLSLTYTPSPVPEPGALALAAFAAASLASWPSARRRRATQST